MNSKIFALSLLSAFFGNSFAANSISCERLPAILTRISADGSAWSLVSQGDGSDAHKAWCDRKTGILWGGCLVGKYRWSEAVETDDNGNITKEIGCGSDDGIASFYGIPVKKPQMAAQSDFEEAYRHGFFEIFGVEAFRQCYEEWTSAHTVLLHFPDEMGRPPVFAGPVFDYALNLRCVSKP